MIETASSRPIRATKIANGISVTKNTTMLVVNSWYRNVLKIFRSVCPATMLAKRRTPRETARARYEISSISTSRGTSARGVPDGTKNAKKWIPCFCRPRIVTPRKIITDSPMLTMIEVVIVKPYGMFPLRFAMMMKKNSEYTNGR